MPNDGFVAVQPSGDRLRRAPLKVLVVGGGIGGLALAIGLGRAGMACDLVEIKQDWAVYGVGLIQPGNALRAYKALGLLEACLDRGFLYTHQRHYDADGELMHEAALPQVDGLDIVGTCGIGRPVLHEILSSEALALGTRVRLGTRVTALEQDGDGVDAWFSDNTCGRYDLVVGADGVRSSIREMVFAADAAALRYTGQGCWRFTTSRPPEMTWSSAHYGPNKAGLIPLSAETMYIYMLTTEPGNPWYAPEQLPGLMRGHLHGYRGLIADVAARIEDPDDVVYRPLEVMLMPRPWHKGRVVMMGDAAHATTPHNAQGAAMAVEDAVVLSTLLAEQGDVEDKLRRFTERRFDRCKLVVEASEQIGAWQLQPTETSQDEAIALHARIRTVLAQPI